MFISDIRACMQTHIKTYFIITGLVFFSFSLYGQNNKKKKVDFASKSEQLETPEQLYGKLFDDILSNSQLFGKGRLFAENKDFLDAEPLFPIAVIRKKYNGLSHKSNADTLINFLKTNFKIPAQFHDLSKDTVCLDRHITNLWAHLTRQPNRNAQGTQIGLSYPFVVPGGRFREMYYWDSYFTMLGLAVDKQTKHIENMVDNFADLIDRLGFIPNGTRTYYLGRSQPPFFCYMIDLLAQVRNDRNSYVRYLPQLEKEYNFWMKGQKLLSNSSTEALHTVKMPDGSVLNRYFDRQASPREEMFMQDRKCFQLYREKTGNQDSCSFYRNLRSAAESGWDFSVRWLGDGKNLYTTQTCRIVPVDLNCLLYHLEHTLAMTYRLKNDPTKATYYREKAQMRKKAILKYCWNNQSGFFEDYNIDTRHTTGVLTLAGLFPLYTQIADRKQAASAAKVVQKQFLKQGGVVTTLQASGQQWDYPNGWAPLQWITFKGLAAYKYTSLADTIGTRWTRLNENVYRKTGKMLEKYDVVHQTDTGGGEYPNQDGFGWTNGVYKAFQNEFTKKKKQ